MNDGQPQIDGMLRLPGEELSDTFIIGKAVRLTGSRLKVTGEGSGLYLCPADGNGSIFQDGADWIQVPASQFSCNRPGKLEFFIPDDVAEGSYRIKLRTFFCNGRQNLKTAISTVSDVITIRKA